jgi:acyl carrier protein
MSSLHQEIADIVKSVCRKADVSAGRYATTFKELGVDSLEVANIFLNITEKYGVDVPDEEIDRLLTIDQVVAYLQPRLGQ